MKLSARFQMLASVLAQSPAARTSHSLTSKFRHLGAFGLFFLAILDSSPIPTFAGTDILTAILAASHRNPWFEYAIVATLGSVVGAYLTYRLAKKAGESYLEKHFSQKRRGMLDFFRKWGTSALAVSTAVPFPFPTSLFFAAAGASKYKLNRFLSVVAVCRGVRYVVIALVADYYGRHFVHILRHPGEYWVGLLLLALFVLGISVGTIVLSRHKESPQAAAVAMPDR